MDTISRENNPSILPIVGVIAGSLAVVLSIAALIQISGVKKTVAQTKDDLTTQVSSMQSSVQQASDAANRANNSITSITKQVQEAFNQVTTEITNIKTEMNKLATAKAPVAKEKGAKGAKGAAGAAGEDAGAAAAGPGGDYTVKSGDTLNKVAKAHGVSLSALEQANPGVDSRHLKVGQKLAIPGGH